MSISRRCINSSVAIAVMCAASGSAVLLSVGHAEFDKKVTIPVSNTRSLNFTIAAEVRNGNGKHELSKRLDVHFVPARPQSVEVNAEVGSANSI